MNVQIRCLRPDDIGLLVQIEKQAFPTLSPPTPFKRELNNRLAKYLVAWAPKPPDEPAPEQVESETPTTPSMFGRLLSTLGVSATYARPSIQLDYRVPGFVGLWFMAGEAHITTIAVEKASRGMGIGELLLMASVQLAMNRDIRVVTLEVRASNAAAQCLYQKYGFRKVGLRKGYYTDDREDALIMTTEPIYTFSFRQRFRRLKDRYALRYGEMSMVLE